ncbi:Inosine-5'-monophosphate dehydrogenase [Sporotomaculum syntrophicum]|uniref:Inosine-5'-monophosphate dehydrogenase n=1 Tax=Sporotomaculum syntrophicum TaxID=182264 RepID=A0A9D2WLZ3_9FIRM|nr:CBS domain-containing protein [Sporotomaculum syntrophicum]KAF1083835.1 Inosine-5'-monophosphate dehydrogenase [Sporotomaculum syntrophicum]
MKKAKDIMTANVITVNSNDDVDKMARLLLEHRISGLPVVDDNGKLVGVVSETDLVFQEKPVRAPFYVVLFDSPIYLENPNRFIHDVKRAVAQKVGALMSTKLYTVGPDASIEDVATIVTEKDVNRVPVVDNDGKLIGIITRQDIIKASFKGEDQK